ncbi:MAG: carboxylesterase family protein [Rhizomicrobium sp.]
MSVIATITQGTLEGFAKDGVLRFNGIPYAKPPVGALRWRPAEAPERWSGVREASRFGNIAPQVQSAAEALIGGTPGEQSEDCLYLNVTTPSLDGKRPVMVWIHGGAFVTGAGSLGTYNGKHLAARGDVVVVTINYRLGALGFLNLRDGNRWKTSRHRHGRSFRSDHGAQMGEGEHRHVRRRSRQCPRSSANPRAA